MTRKKSLFSVLFAPPRRRRKAKGFFATLLEGQAKTEKKNKMYPRKK